MGKRPSFACLKTLSYMIVIEFSCLVEVKGYGCDPTINKPCKDKFTYVPVLNACLKPEKFRLTWTKAAYVCGIRGGSLVKVDTQEKAEAVSEFARDNNLPVYWVGLEFNDNSKVFEWTFDRSELKKGMYQPFMNTKDRNGATLCVSSNVGQTVEWTYTDCSDKKQFICHMDSAYMPKKPEVTVYNHDLESTLFRGGEELDIECVANLKQGGHLRLVLLTASGFEIIKRTKERLVEYYEEKKVQPDGGCMLVTHLKMKLKVTPDLHGKTLACISYMKSKSSQICSKGADPYCKIAGRINVEKGQQQTTPIPTLEPPRVATDTTHDTSLANESTSEKPPLTNESTSQPPQLTTGQASPAPGIGATPSPELPERPIIDKQLKRQKFKIGSKLKASCKAILCDKGDLRFLLISATGTRMFDSDNKNVHYQESTKPGLKGECDRRGIATLTLTVEQEMEGTTLACVSYTDSNIRACSQTDPYCAIAGTIRVLPALKPHRPKITNTGYDIQEDTIRKGSQLGATCTAELCDTGDLKFVLVSENGAAETIDEKHVHYREYIDMDSEEGCNRKGVGTLSTTVTSHLHGKTLACLSFTDTSIKACSKQDKYCTVLGTINVREGVMPRRPRIIVEGYNLRKDTIKEGSEIVVICDALLCDKGHLSFVLLAGDYARPLNSSDDRVFYLQNLPYKITETCVRRGMGRLTLKVTKELRGLTLACVSYINKTMVTCSPQDPYCAVAGKINIDTDEPRNAFSTLWLLIPLLLLPAIICVIWFLVSPKDDEIKEQTGEEAEKSRSGEDRERFGHDIPPDFDTVTGSEHMSGQMSSQISDVEMQRRFGTEV